MFLRVAASNVARSLQERWGYALQVSLEQSLGGWGGEKGRGKHQEEGQQPASNTCQEALRVRRQASGDRHRV